MNRQTPVTGKPASDTRFYLLEFPQRPVLWGDIGNLLKIEGIVVGGSGVQIALLLPQATEPLFGSVSGRGAVETIHLDIDEWSEFIRRSVNPEVLTDLNTKVFQRKLRYEISGATQQKVWAADNFECVYCKRRMGDVPLTIDHWMPIELQGANDASNYLSACRACNKAKSSMHPHEWCRIMHYDPERFEHYLRKRRV